MLRAFVAAVLVACGGTDPGPAAGPSPSDSLEPPATPLADVVSVEVTGEPGRYEFAVGVASPDTGCGQYSDWWEVVSTEGELIVRRPLAHSHVDEQPFVRSGGPVAIDAATTVWVRAHMYPMGYGGKAMKGSVEAGFAPAEMPSGLADGVGEKPPHPPPCGW